jgi:hypothetical protein
MSLALLEHVGQYFLWDYYYLLLDPETDNQEFN